jgi:membrane protein
MDEEDHGRRADPSRGGPDQCLADSCDSPGVAGSTRGDAPARASVGQVSPGVSTPGRLRVGEVPRLLRDMLAGVIRARTLGLAAEMSFWLFLSLVPLAAVAGFVAARLVTSGDEWLAPSMLAFMPPSAGALVADQVGRVSAWGHGFVPIAVGTFFWLASSGVHSVFDALEVQSGTSRHWWRKRLLAMATCIGLSAAVTLVALLGAGLDWMQGLVHGSTPTQVVADGHREVVLSLRWVAAAVVSVGTVSGLYWLGIRDARRPMAIVPGAVLAVALIGVLGGGYRFYIARIGGGDAYEAGLTVVGVTLMTLWLFSVALLLGVQLNRTLSDRNPTRARRS